MAGLVQRPPKKSSLSSYFLDLPFSLGPFDELGAFIGLSHGNDFVALHARRLVAYILYFTVGLLGHSPESIRRGIENCDITVHDATKKHDLLVVERSHRWEVGWSKLAIVHREMFPGVLVI